MAAKHMPVDRTARRLLQGQARGGIPTNKDELQLLFSARAAWAMFGHSRPMLPGRPYSHMHLPPCKPQMSTSGVVAGPIEDVMAVVLGVAMRAPTPGAGPPASPRARPASFLLIPTPGLRRPDK